MTSIQVAPQFQALFRALEWSDFHDVAKHFTGGATLRGEVFVKPATINASGEAVDVFFKQYRYERPSWRFLGRPSKARREFDNYGTLSNLGIPVAERIASGEERDRIGRLRAAWILTRAVPNSRTLVQFAEASSRELAGSRKQLTLELAAITRTIHQARFFYHDIVWRNILVSVMESGQKLFLIDCPRGGISKFGRGRQRLRDLASLDKSAVRFSRKTERLKFLLAYLAKPRLDDEAKALARATVAYRKRRWPEDWPGK